MSKTISVWEEKYHLCETSHLIPWSPDNWWRGRGEVVGESNGIADGSGGSLDCGLMRTPVSPLLVRMILTFFPFLKASAS